MTRSNSITRSNVPTLWNSLDLRDEWLAPMDRFFDQAFNQVFPQASKLFGVDEPFKASAFPKVNILNYDNRVEIHAELAGLVKDDISIEIEDGSLIISGQHSKDEVEEDVSYILRELKHSRFRRTFRLSDTLNAESIDASFDNGLLCVTIPKKEPDTPTKKVVEIR